MLERFKIMVDVPLRVIEMDDSLIAPEVDRNGFQSRQVVAEIGDGGILDVPVPSRSPGLAPSPEGSACTPSV